MQVSLVSQPLVSNKNHPTRKNRTRLFIFISLDAERI